MAYRPSVRSEQRKAQTRERIVAAALEQLGEGGYASATVQAVAARAGVATGSVYLHFPSKGDLFAEVFRRASRRELETVAGIAADHSLGARDRVAAAVETFARRALAAPVQAYALIAEPVDPAVEAERLAFRRGYRDVFKAAIEAGIAAGEIERLDVEVAAAALVGALGEALVGPLSPGRAPGAREALVASLVGFALGAIPPRAGRVPATN